MLTKMLAFAATGSLVVQAALAQSYSLPIPSNVPINHINLELGSDGIMRADAGGFYPPANCPDVPLFDQTLTSGYYFPTQAQIFDSYPLGGPALINSIQFCTYCPSGANVLNFSVFDYPNIPGDIYERVCLPKGTMLCTGTLTAPSGINLITITFPTPCQTKCSDIMIGTQMLPAGGATQGGLLVASGAAQGLVLGHPISFTNANYGKDTAGLLAGYQSSPGDSSNGFVFVDVCQWFGGRPMGNFCVGIRGWFAYTGHLTGDYGTLGGMLTAPKNYMKVLVTDSAGSFFDDVLVRVTDAHDPAGPGYFSLPFNCVTHPPYNVYIYGFDGYLNACDIGVNIVPFTQNCRDIALVTGDLTGDNQVNIFDLNSMLINFGTSGCTIPAHSIGVSIPFPEPAVNRCVP